MQIFLKNYENYIHNVYIHLFVRVKLTPGGTTKKDFGISEVFFVCYYILANYNLRESK